MSSPGIDTQQARKARNSQSLQRATIGVGVAALALAGGLTYAAAAASSNVRPATDAHQTGPTIVSPSPAVEQDDGGDNPRPPATSLQNPNPGVAPVAVTGGS